MLGSQTTNPWIPIKPWAFLGGVGLGIFAKPQVRESGAQSLQPHTDAGVEVGSQEPRVRRQGAVGETRI